MFTLWNLEVSDFYQLVPFHTDCLTLSFITSLFSKLVTVAAYNFMTMLKEVKVDQYETGFASFYFKMSEVPFFGGYYNYIIPAFIVLLGILTLFKMQSKVSGFTKRFKKKETTEFQLNQKKEKGGSNDEVVQRMKAGEKVIIDEWNRRKR